jgi:hypothetical protein
LDFLKILSRVDVQSKQSLSGIVVSSEAMKMFVDVGFSSKRSGSGFDLLASQIIKNKVRSHMTYEQPSSLRLENIILFENLS